MSNEHVEVLERLRGVLEHGKMGDKCLIAPDLVEKVIASLSAPQSRDAESKLAEAGVFAGHHGLRGLAHADVFWEKQPYGTRLYYGDGGMDYLHRGVLQKAVEILDAAPQPPAEAQPVAPRAPVGVEELIVDWESDLAEDKRDGVAEVAIRVQEIRLDQLRALAQQPLTHGEAVAEVVEAEGYYGVGGWVKQPDDARDVRGLRGIRGLPIGTKLYLAQQPAYDGGFTAADMMDARQEGRKEAQQPAAVDESMANLRDAILRNDGLTRKNTLAAFRAVEDALAAQQGGRSDD